MLNYTISIGFDPRDVAMMRELSNSIGRLKHWHKFWDNGGIVELMKRDIKRNIQQGVTPELKTWPLLSEKYQRQVGRPRMMLSQNAVNTYADMAKITALDTHMTYEPNPSFVRKHYHMLRAGWNSATGGNAPPREWFGIYHGTVKEMGVKLHEFIERELSRATGAVYGGR